MKREQRKMKTREAAKGARKGAVASKRGRQRSSPPGGGSGDQKDQKGGILVALVAMAAGVGTGWFIRDTTIEPLVKPDQTAGAEQLPVPSGKVPKPPECQQWEDKVCQAVGVKSEGCSQIRAAAAVMPAPACQSALADVPTTIARLKDGRSACDKVVARLCADLGKESSTCKMATVRTPSLPVARCEQMLANYDDMVAQARQAEERDAPPPPPSSEQLARLQAADSPSFGPADAKVVVVQYADFQCPSCAKAAGVVTQIKERYGSVVRFVYRSYPLPQHPDAQRAAEAALAAHEQGKFWAYHDRLFKEPGDLSAKALAEHAAKVGLDLDGYNKAVADSRFKPAIQRDMELAEDLGVRRTPTMFVGSERIKTPTDFAAIAKQIDAQLKTAGVSPKPRSSG